MIICAFELSLMFYVYISQLCYKPFGSITTTNMTTTSTICNSDCLYMCSKPRFPIYMNETEIYLFFLCLYLEDRL